MSSEPFLIRDIVWVEGYLHLPKDSIVYVSGSLLDLNYEDFEDEEPSCTCDVSEDDDDYDDFECLGGCYEASAAALEAFERAWDNSMRRYLEEQHGGTVVSYGYFGPAPDEPVRVALWMSSAAVSSPASPTTGRAS